VTLRAQAAADAPILYQRIMNYSGDKLMSESISSGGKRSKIEHKYSGNKLVEASCDEDPSIDGRSRRATFID
jgi:hypothetical protein